MNDIQELEDQLAGAKKLAARRQMALRLAENPDFKKLIREEYMVSEAARYVQASGDPNLGPVERADALAIAQASGHLKRYLHVITQMGYVAEREIPEIESAIDDARAEDNEGDDNTHLHLVEDEA